MIFLLFLGVTARLESFTHVWNPNDFAAFFFSGELMASIILKHDGLHWFMPLLFVTYQPPILYCFLANFFKTKPPLDTLRWILKHQRKNPLSSIGPESVEEHRWLSIYMGLDVKTFQRSICLAAFDHTSAHAEFPTQKMVVKIHFL